MTDPLAVESPPNDPLSHIPDPDTVRDLIGRSVRRTMLLRALLKVAARKRLLLTTADRLPTTPAAKAKGVARG